MKISSFAVDEKLEVSGIWKELGDGAAVLVARTNNPVYSKKLRALMSPFQGPVGLLPIGDELAEKIFAEATAEGILLDWRGLTDEVDKEVVYSKEKAVEWLLKYKEFRKIIEVVSENIENYRNNVEEEIKESIKK